MAILSWLWSNWFLGAMIASLITLYALGVNKTNFDDEFMFEILIRIVFSLIFSWLIVFIVIMLRILTLGAVEASEEYNKLEQEQKINEVKNE